MPATITRKNILRSVSARVSKAVEHYHGRQTSLLRGSIPFPMGEIEVDETNGVIRNAAVMTLGPTIGHDFDIDSVTLQQTCDLLNAKGPDGAPMRFKHPEISKVGDQFNLSDALGTVVGQLKNPRIAGNSVRGDIFLGDYAKNLPGLGDVRTYLLGLAKDFPTSLGLSTVIDWDPEVKTNSVGDPIAIVARVVSVDYVDFVGKPAANPNGLLCAGPVSKASSIPSGIKSPGVSPGIVPKVHLRKGAVLMHSQLKGMLVANGCDPAASDEDFQTFYDGLAADKKADVDSKHASFLAANPDEQTQMSAAGEGDAQASGGTATMSATQIANIATTAALAAVRSVQRTTQVDAATTRRLAAQATDAAAAQRDPNDVLIEGEKKRVNQIDQLAATYGLPPEAALAAKASTKSFTEIRTDFLRQLQESNPPVQAVRVEADRNITSLRDAIPHAVMLRAGFDFKRINQTPHERASQLSGMRLLDMYREYLMAYGADSQEVWRMSHSQLASIIGPRGLRKRFPRVAQLAESTSDFGGILLDAMNKSLRFSYLDAPRSWTKWMARTTAPDFKNINRVVLSESPSLVPRVEGKEIVYAVLTDSKETYQLAEFISGIKLTRRTIINDDLDAFATLPRAQANAAARLEEDLAYAPLTNNVAMADGFNIFDSSNHANDVVSGGPPSISQLAAMETAIMTQVGPAQAAILELIPKFLLVPTALKAATEQLVSSKQLIAIISSSGASQTAGDSNPYADKFLVIPSVRLNRNSPLKWYMAADFRDGQINTAEMAFLADEPEPVAKQETDFDTEDVKFAIRHTAACKVIDYRGFARNAGA
jgi:hypothetical protein